MNATVICSTYDIYLEQKRENIHLRITWNCLMVRTFLLFIKTTFLLRSYNSANPFINCSACSLDEPKLKNNYTHAYTYIYFFDTRRAGLADWSCLKI